MYLYNFVFSSICENILATKISRYTVQYVPMYLHVSRWLCPTIVCSYHAWAYLDYINVVKYTQLHLLSSCYVVSPIQMLPSALKAEDTQYMKMQGQCLCVHTSQREGCRNKWRWFLPQKMAQLLVSSAMYLYLVCHADTAALAVYDRGLLQTCDQLSLPLQMLRTSLGLYRCKRLTPPHRDTVSKFRSWTMILLKVTKLSPSL